jgi:RimJ/RimL family protein N-acetyltransferase
VSSPIETPRLHLEPFSERHLSDQYVRWLNDPEVVRFSEQRHRRHTRESAAAYMRSFEGTANCLWAIVTKEPENLHVGNISASVDPENGVADIGLLIGEKSRWGRGFGTEAWTAVCRFLIDQKSIRKVSAGAAVANRGMLEIMRRAGMKEDGVRARHLVIDGQELDVVHMALFRSNP